MYLGPITVPASTNNHTTTISTASAMLDSFDGRYCLKMCTINILKYLQPVNRCAFITCDKKSVVNP